MGYTQQFGTRKDRGRHGTHPWLAICRSHRLLIEDLDASELEAAIMLTANTADGVDEDLQKLFGGKRCLDLFEWEE